MKKILFMSFLILKLSAAGAQEYRFYAVSSDGGNQKPVYLCELDSVSGAISIIENYAGVVKGNYFALSSDQKQLLVTSLNSAQNQGGLVQYNISADGRLSSSHSQFKPGGIPCHVSFTPDMNYALSAYYGGDKISICNFSNGEITPETDEIVKADNSKGHCILTDPSGRYVYAVFLGMDKVFSYTIEEGEFVANTTQEYFSLPDGFGPRHLVFHPDSSWVYILNELNSSVTAGSLNLETGSIVEMQNISMLPPDFSGQNSAAAIRIHPNGRFLYASNRGHNSIAVYEIELDGTLSIIEYETSGINVPRDFNISEDGKFMLVGNQKGNSIFSFRINESSGELDYTGKELAMSSPIAMVFLSSFGKETVGLFSGVYADNGLETIFPNPAKDFLHFNSPDETAIENIEIYNLSGQLLNSYSGKSISNIDVSTMPRGTLLLVMDTEVEKYSQKIILK